jgi:NAD(P)-dependent dehydrogenase (short-subunit alcohol dehydrogenase family)
MTANPDIGFDFTGRVVLVTGVARTGQIGHAVARAFGLAGAKLVACDLNAVAVAGRAREFVAEGIDARPAAGDLTEPDVARLAVETAIKYFGRLDAVINVAGGLTTYGPIEKTTEVDFDREIAINLKTTVLVSQAALPELTKTAGCIVNVASIAYVQPQSPMAVYSAAKAAVAGFTRSLAHEVSDRRVRVNAIAPAMVRTNDNVAQSGADAQYVEMGQITDGILFLASPAAVAITGQILPITSGQI